MPQVLVECAVAENLLQEVCVKLQLKAGIDPKSVDLRSFNPDRCVPCASREMADAVRYMCGGSVRLFRIGEKRPITTDEWLFVSRRFPGLLSIVAEGSSSDEETIRGLLTVQAEMAAKLKVTEATLEQSDARAKSLDSRVRLAEARASELSAQCERLRAELEAAKSAKPQPVLVVQAADLKPEKPAAKV